MELLRDELDIVYRRGEPRELYRAVSRVLWLLGIGPADKEVPARIWASIEWSLCPSITVHPKYCTFLGLKQAHCDPPETGAEKKSRKFSQNLPIPHTAAFCCTGKRPLAGDLRVGLRFWSFFHV
jgi:hypothetical protein